MNVNLTSKLKTASDLLSENAALIKVKIKNDHNNQRFLFLRPVKKVAVFILKKPISNHMAIIADNTNDPKGRQKQKSKGKK